MMSFLTGKWNFFLVGAVFAFLLVLSIYCLNDNVGMNEGYMVISDYVVEEDNHGEMPDFNWQTAFLVGVVIGGIAGAVACKDWKLIMFPEDRDNKKFIASCIVSVVQGIGGGFLVMLGLQLVGDSFLGHWSGMVQQSTGSTFFLLFVFLFSIGIKMVVEGYKVNTKGSKSG